MRVYDAFQEAYQIAVEHAIENTRCKHLGAVAISTDTGNILGMACNLPGLDNHAELRALRNRRCVQRG